MDKKSDDESSEKQPADSPTKQESKLDDSETKPAGSSLELEEKGESGTSEQPTSTQSTSSDKRKLDEKYLASVEVSKESVLLSPIKRKCTEKHISFSEIIQPEETLFKEDETEPGSSGIDVIKQRSPKNSPTKPGTSVAGIKIQESPEQSPTKPGTSAAGIKIQESPEQSPTKCGTSEAGIKILDSLKQSPSKRGTSETGIKIQESPKRSPTKPETSAAGIKIEESPKRSPTKPETSAADVIMLRSPNRSSAIPGTSAASDVTVHESPKRSPTKRTYQERQQTYNVDELVEKRLREEVGYQSDSALDLRTDQPDSALDLRTDRSDTALDLRQEFKKEKPTSTQSSSELHCQPTSSDKPDDVSVKCPASTYSAQSGSSTKSAASEVTSSEDAEADVSSTSSESVTSTTSRATSSAQGRREQNEPGARETSPRASRASGARPREASRRCRSVEYVHVSFPKFSPSRRFYGEPIIRRRSAQEAPGFKVPPPPPPIEERQRPVRIIRNGLDSFFSLIEDYHAIITAEYLAEQMRKEAEEKARREREQAENFARAKIKAAETTRRLREREARARAGEAVAGPSGLCRGSAARIGSSPRVHVEEPVDIHESLEEEALQSSEQVSESESLPAVGSSEQDANANVSAGGSSISTPEDDNANKLEPCSTSQTGQQEADEEKPSSSGVAAPNLEETLAIPPYLSLQQLVPQIDEISLDDSLENIALVDSEQEDDNVDLQNI